MVEAGLDAFCSGLGQVGLDCSAQIVEIRLGHVLLVAFLAAVFSLLFRFTIFRDPQKRGFSQPVELNF